MKTKCLFLALLIYSCSKPDPVFDALSKEGLKPNIISVIPTNSRCPDSLDWQNSLTEFRLNLRLSGAALQIPESELAKNLNAAREGLRQKNDSLYQIVAAQTAPTPGFSLVRYTVNREPDTLTAVLGPSFRVVWPR